MRVGKGHWRCLIVLALLAAATAVHADYKDDYAHGLKAFRDGQYAEARTLMQQSLDGHAEPAVKMRLYGQVYEPYLPQHYIGMAAFKLGDCATAMAQWNSAENRQIVAQLPEIGGQEQSGVAACEQKGFAKNGKQQTVTPEVTPEKPVVAQNPPPKTTVADNKPAKPVVTPPKPVEPAAKPVAEKPVVEKPPVAARTAPPEPLVQAFDNYLAGKYAEVARINPDSYADTRARFQAYLVRAASKYTSARISKDADMMSSAAADTLAAKAIDGRTTPDATMFSPGFRAFYRESR